MAEPFLDCPGVWPLLGRWVQDAGRIRHKSMTDRLAVVELIGATTTKTGLKVDCALDTRTYQKGIKVSNAEMKALNITGDRFHPEWNYKITPRQQPP